MPFSGHQAKRPYAGSQYQSQAHITSYFPAHPLNYEHSTSAAYVSTYTDANNILHPQETGSEANTALSTPLPALVQSNLLSVGMRVRKAVPEGYKTGSGYGGFTLFSDTKTASEVAGSGLALIQKSTHTGYIPAPAKKELTPFCGIMKVGGMAVQTHSSWMDEDRDADIPTEDEIPILSSQGSTISTSSVASISSLLGSGTKRRFSEEDIEKKGASKIWLDHRDRFEIDVEISPKSKPASLPAGLGSRPVAIPKSRMKRHQHLQENEWNANEGQENMNTIDFDEAEFLDYTSGFIGGNETVMYDL